MDKREIYTKYLRILMQLIRESYERKGLKASGAFGNSLEMFESGSIIGIKGNSYGLNMERGRSAGAWSNIEQLKQWIKDKEGLPQVFKDNPDRFAFLIARKHFLQGVKVPNEHNEGGVLSEPIELFVKEHLPFMWKELGDFYIVEMKREFTTILAA